MGVPTVNIAIADTNIKIGDTPLVTFTFSEAVYDFTNSDLTAIEGGTLGTVTDSGDGITWTATFTPTASTTDATNVITLDKDGVISQHDNLHGVGTTSSNSYAIDTAAPTVGVVVTDATLTAGETSLVTITFNEIVTGFDNADLSIANGTLSNVVDSGDGKTFTATLTPTAGLVLDATNVITVNKTGVTDAAGNAGVGTTDSNNYSVSTVRPSANVVFTDSTLTAGETSLVTITFTEAVTGFANADLTIENGILSAVSSGDGGTTWTATFTPTAAIYDTSNVITLNLAGVTGVTNSGAGTVSSANYRVETGHAPVEPDPNPPSTTPSTGSDVITMPINDGNVSAGAGADVVTGNVGKDVIAGNTGNDTLSGGFGEDTLTGGQDNDVVNGNVGDDKVFGDLGNDVVLGGQGQDLVQGNTGDDYVSGDVGNDTVLGGQGADQVFGGVGADYISGDLGDDKLNGGEGADTFNFAAGSGRDVVADFSQAQGDHIRIATSDAANFSSLSSHFSMVGGDTGITLTGQTIVLTGVASSSLVASDFIFG